MTDDIAVRNGSRDYIWWLKLIPIAGFIAFVWDRIYIGANASHHMMSALFSVSI